MLCNCLIQLIDGSDFCFFFIFIDFEMSIEPHDYFFGSEIDSGLEGKLLRPARLGVGVVLRKLVFKINALEQGI